jgi:hypothetical protein
VTFGSTRPDPARLARVSFGDEWLALDPAHLASCDVMDVRVRMGMYRLLVERTNLRGALGAHDELSPFWGYASQLAWQARSGRLGEGRDAIDPGSWWGACNYALSVVPYVAAMRAGLVPHLSIEIPRGYEAAMPAWDEASRALAAPTCDHDRVRVTIWRAHLASITIAVGLHDREYRAMPEAEQRFARGWVRMVDLFAAAAVRTDLDKLVETGGGALPSRVLRAGDPHEDLPRYERSTVRRVGELADRRGWRWAIELRLWRRMMRTRAARLDAERLLAGLFGKDVWSAAARALGYLIR